MCFHTTSQSMNGTERAWADQPLPLCMFIVICCRSKCQQLATSSLMSAQLVLGKLSPTFRSSDLNWNDSNWYEFIQVSSSSPYACRDCLRGKKSRRRKCIKIMQLCVSRMPERQFEWVREQMRSVSWRKLLISERICRHFGSINHLRLSKTILICHRARRRTTCRRVAGKIKSDSENLFLLESFRFNPIIGLILLRIVHDSWIKLKRREDSYRKCFAHQGEKKNEILATANRLGELI